jgi:hypothetical protein
MTETANTVFILFYWNNVFFTLSAAHSHEQFFSYQAAVIITIDMAANLDLCLALMAISIEGSFTCNIYCYMGPQFIRCHSKDRHPRPTMRFDWLIDYLFIVLRRRSRIFHLPLPVKGYKI